MNNQQVLKLMLANKDDDAMVDLSSLLQPQAAYDYKLDQTISNIHHFDINRPIGSPRHYTNMLNVLRSATEMDAIVMHINSPGGRLDTTIQIINALQHTAATTYGILEGEAASAASAILLNCEEIHVMPNTMMMIHNYSGDFFGNASNVKATIDAYNTAYYDTFKAWYVPFLTEAEFEVVMSSGLDQYYNADQVVDRLERRAKILEQEFKKAERDAKRAEKAAIKPVELEPVVEAQATKVVKRSTKTTTVNVTE